jgi:three-Cys-motif partner protein
MENYLLPADDGLPMQTAGAWTAIKLDYISRYMNAFETAMRDKWPVRNYIDLLAGSGKNHIRHSKKILLGSPLLALTTYHPFTGYFFADKSAKYTRALDRRCSISAFYSRVRIYTGDCNQLVDKVVDDLHRVNQRALNLAFLDPRGMELKWRTVTLLASLHRMDMVIYYPEMGFTRYMGTAFAIDRETSVDLFFGGREWREIYAIWQNKRGLQRELIGLYKTKLQALGYPYVFRGDEGIGDEPLIRSQSRNAPLYRLIFASKHELGHKLWSDIVRRDVYGQKRLL